MAIQHRAYSAGVSSFLLLCSSRTLLGNVLLQVATVVRVVFWFEMPVYIYFRLHK